MGRTSNRAKQAWNAAHYTQVKISVNPETAAAFKAACTANGVSMASTLTDFMAEYAGTQKPPAEKRKEKRPNLTTRQHRRKEAERLLKALEAIKEAEEAYKDNIPENLQGSARYDAAEKCIGSLEEACELLEQAYG